MTAHLPLLMATNAFRLGKKTLEFSMALPALSPNLLFTILSQQVAQQGPLKNAFAFAYNHQHAVSHG